MSFSPDIWEYLVLSLLTHGWPLPQGAHFPLICSAACPCSAELLQVQWLCAVRVRATVVSATLVSATLVSAPPVQVRLPGTSVQQLQQCVAFFPMGPLVLNFSHF